MTSEGARRLRDLIDVERPLVVPGVFDCLTAKIAETLDFKAVYIGSHSTSASLLGMPDTGFLERRDQVDQIWRIADAVTIPIVADAEGGFGNAVHVPYTVRRFEQAGAAALHIEDHVFGKHLTGKPHILPEAEAVLRVRAAVDARQSPDFMIIARTDLALSEDSGGLSAIIDRLQSFSDAGADMVFAPGLDLRDIEVVSAQVAAPLVDVNAHPKEGSHGSVSEMRSAGLRMVLYYGLASFVTYSAVRRCLSILRAEGSIDSFRDELVPLSEFDQFIGIGDVADLAKQYGALDSSQLAAPPWPLPPGAPRE